MSLSMVEASMLLARHGFRSLRFPCKGAKASDFSGSGMTQEYWRSRGETDRVWPGSSCVYRHGALESYGFFVEADESEGFRCCDPVPDSHAMRFMRFRRRDETGNLQMRLLGCNIRWKLTRKKAGMRGKPEVVLILSGFDCWRVSDVTLLSVSCDDQHPHVPILLPVGRVRGLWGLQQFFYPMCFVCWYSDLTVSLSLSGGEQVHD